MLLREKCSLPCGGPADSVGNPSVHSLSVTLGNHAFHDFQTYNWPCPVGHSPILIVALRDRTREQPPAFSGFVAILFAVDFLKRTPGSGVRRSYGTVRLQQAEGPRQCGEVCPAGQATECH